MKKNKYYVSLDIVRFMSCIGVLLYHLNVLKGGYLAVCIFFVLSGYLSCVSLFKNDKVDLLKYYTSRIKKVYIPLIVVVFISSFIILLLKGVVYLNLKPEVYSILLFYNNYWQINANMDYFARFVSSPFMHFWYISILLQFELVFPFIFMLLKKIGEKLKKTCLFLITLVTAVATGYFVYLCFSSNSIMGIYYGTLSRIFSLLFGVLLGFIHQYYKHVVFDKLKKYSKFIFYGYLLLLIVLFITISSTDKLFSLAMVLSTIVSCRLIEYGIIYDSKRDDNNTWTIIKVLSSISYEVYLVQYPIIYLCEYFKISGYLKIGIVFIFSFIIGYLLHEAFNIKFKNNDYSLYKKIYKYALFFVFVLLGCFGCFKFITSYDYSKDMKKLENELQENEKKMALKQKEYLEKVKNEKIDWEKKLLELESDQSKLGEVISNLSIVGVGDSVMLGAIDNLYGMFPNGYFDAKKSRTDYEAGGILSNLKNNGMLGDVVVFSLGTNGSGPDYLKDDIYNILEGRESYWINVVNDADVHVNNRLASYASSHENVHIIDWVSYSSSHPEYFVSDRIHLTDVGREAYAKCIYESIYNEYLNNINKKRDEMIKEHEDLEKNKYSFVGNDLLLNISSNIQESILDANYYVDNYNSDDLINYISKYVSNNELHHNVVFMFDSSFIMNEKIINDICDILKDYNIYLVILDDLNFKINDSIKLIDFSSEIKVHNDYLMVDRVHLTKKGNDNLVKFIRRFL